MLGGGIGEIGPPRSWEKGVPLPGLRKNPLLRGIKVLPPLVCHGGCRGTTPAVTKCTAVEIVL